MSFYDRWILPRALDVVMRNKEVARHRSRLVPEARGVVLEVGIGSGLNLPFYGAQVERVYGIDPSENLLRMARKRARSVRFPVEFFARPGETIPIEDHFVDTVVTMFTLCTDCRSGRGTARDAPRAQPQRPSALRRTRFRPGSIGTALAASLQSAVEQDRRRLQSGPENGPADQIRGF